MICTYVELLLTLLGKCDRMKIHREKQAMATKKKNKKVVDKDKMMCYSNRVVSNKTTNTEH